MWRSWHDYVGDDFQMLVTYYTGLLKRLQKNPDFHIFGKKSSSRTSRPKKQDFHGYPKQVKKSGLLIWPIRNFSKLWSVGNRSWLVQSLTNIKKIVTNIYDVRICHQDHCWRRHQMTFTCLCSVLAIGINLAFESKNILFINNCTEFLSYFISHNALFWSLSIIIRNKTCSHHITSHLNIQLCPLKTSVRQSPGSMRWSGQRRSGGTLATYEGESFRKSSAEVEIR